MVNLGKKYIAFDLDNTLVDSGEFNRQMFIKTFEPHLTISRKRESYLSSLHTKNRGASMLSLFSIATNRYQLKIEPLQLIEENESLHLKHIKDVEIFDSAKRVVKKFKKQKRTLAIFSNRQKSSLEKIIRINKLQKYFSYIISCEDYEKPNPYLLLELIKKVAEPKEKFLYFGDSTTDQQFAQNAGVDYIKVSPDQKYFCKELFKT